MARPGTLCIATVTVLVILAAAVQPGEHAGKPQESAHVHLHNGLCQCKKSLHIKWSSLLLQYLFLHVLHCDLLLLLFCFAFIARTIAAARTIRCPLLVIAALGYIRASRLSPFADIKMLSLSHYVDKSISWNVWRSSDKMQSPSITNNIIICALRWLNEWGHEEWQSISCRQSFVSASTDNTSPSCCPSIVSAM